MKKFIGFLTILLVLAVAYSGNALDGNDGVIMRQVHNAVALAASATSEGNVVGSHSFNLQYLRPVGIFSLQYEISGAGGTAKFEYLPSLDCVNYPNTGIDIASGLTSSSGPASDGKDLVSFSPEPAICLKILATETGGASGVTVTTRIMIQ